MGQDRRIVRIGTRGSVLARTQTEWVAAKLRAIHPGIHVITTVIQTTGDLRRDVPFTQVGTKGMFVKEIEQALLDGAVDVGVHSLKDMPAEMPGGLIIGCVPQREDPRDALVSASGKPLNELPNGAVIGTSSLRRQAQLRAFNPTFRVEELRGNLDTRLRRLDEGRYDAIVIACAGLIRLGFGARITEALSPVTCVPAVGQGAIAVQTRAEDSITLALVAALDHRDTADAVAAERGFLIALEGGCTLPAGALAEVEGELLRIAGVIVSPDGVHAVRDSVSGPRTQAASLGSTLANILIERGGRALLEG